MTYDLIQVGTGGQGASWCERFLPPNIEAGRVNVVAAVDVNPDALDNAREYLGLSTDACYTDVKTALSKHDADICTVVVPPDAHEEIVDVALAHDVNILSEKPIADSMEASVRIVEKVDRAGVKMGVTMSHRFDQDKTTLRRALKSGDTGPLDYLVYRLTNDMRGYGDWGAEHLHELPDQLMISGAIHHFDILADLAGAPCESVFAQTWNPNWGEYAGDSQGLAILEFENGIKAQYEGAKTNAVGLNPVGCDYIRAECRDCTLLLDDRRLERFSHDPESRTRAREGDGEKLPLVERPTWGNTWLIEQFVDWLDGGDPMATNIEANLQSTAIVFAAIESSRTGEAVNVQEFLRQTREAVDV